MAGRYHRPTTPEEKARADQARTAKLEALHGRLAEQVAALRTGEDWQRWLATAARFHTYSFGNTMLILAQRPEATAVAGYEAWKALGRQVDKGQKGIAILAPVVRRQTAQPSEPPSATDPAADAAAVAVTTDDDAPASRLAGFRVAYVWDVAQTSGRPLPTAPTPQLLEGDAPDGLWDALAAVVTSTGYRLERGPCGRANGVTIPAERLVRVRDDIDDAQAVKTLAHELGHVLLHAVPVADGEQTRELLCRGVVEVEAESVAYLISAAHGLDSGTYTFPYVAHWADGVAGQRAEDVVRATGQRVLGAAQRLLAATLPEQILGDEPAPDLAERARAAQTSTSALRARAEHSARTASGQALDDAPSARSAPSRPVTDTARSRASISRSASEVTRDELLHAHRLAVTFYQDRVSDSWVPEYLASRSLTAALGTPWCAGYAPAEWHALTDHLRTHGLDDAVLLAAGLATTNRNGRLIDRFRDRLMLPVRELAGGVVGFVARANPEADPDQVPRYVNSPQTALYRKATVLFGLSEAQGALRAGAKPVLVEGPLDAVAVTEGTGGRCVGVAGCGTALTDAHVAALAEVVDLRARGVVVAMDADEPGLASAQAAFPLLAARRVAAAIAALPDEHDPASLLHQQGFGALTGALLDHARPLADVVIDARLAEWSDRLQWVEGRIAAVRDIAPLIAALPPDDMSRQALRLAERLDVDVTTVQREIVPFIGARTSSYAGPGRRSALRSARDEAPRTGRPRAPAWPRPTSASPTQPRRHR